MRCDSSKENERLRMKLMHVLGVAVLTVSLCAPSAFAITKNYELGTGSFVSANSTDPGLTIETSIDAGVSGKTFALDDGQSTAFSFFKIWTTESTVNAGEDTVPMSISATLDFTDPSTGATVKGVTFGGFALFGLTQYGAVTWNGPVTVDVPGDRSFLVSLNDAKFDSGLFGLSGDQRCGATIKATVTQVSSNGRSVPDGASTAGMLGLAFLGLGALRRKLGA
jgi:hypothetical protein